MKESRGLAQNPRAAEFAQLFADWERRIFLYALSLVHNPADAQEVLQETSLFLWQNFDRYQPGTDFGRWAHRVAYYEALKLRDRNGRQGPLFSNKFLELVAAEAESTADQLDTRREALGDCLGKLSPGDRQLVTCRYQSGATTRSVAEALGRGVQGTRKALHRIRSRLLACIQRTLAAEERA